MDLNIQLSKENNELEALRKYILTFNSLKIKEIDCMEYNEILSRADVIITTLVDKMNKMQEEFITIQTLRDISSQVNSINTNLSNFINSKYTNYLTQANSNIESLIGLMSKLCFTDKETIQESLASVVGNYKRQLTNLEKKVVKYESQIEKYEKDITNLSNAIEKQQTIIEGFSQQFSDAQIKRDTDFTDKITEYNQKNSSNQELIKREWHKMQEAFTLKAKNIFDEFADDTTEKEGEWGKIKENFDTEFQHLKDDLSLKTKKAVDEITQRNEEVEKLYGLFGKNVTCGNFKKHADNETFVIWVLYIGAFCIILKGALFIMHGIQVDYELHKMVNWVDILARIPIVFVLYAPALYLALEAKKRHNRQIELRDFELKIASIDPYLKNIDFVESRREQENPDKLSARDVKLELAKDLFSTNKKHSKSDNLIIPKDVIEFMEQISKIYNWNNCNQKEQKFDKE